MASKRRLRRRSCLNKERYNTLPEAQAAAYKASGRLKSRMLPYKCDYCSGFHKGHPPARIKQAIKARMGTTF